MRERSPGKSCSHQQTGAQNDGALQAIDAQLLQGEHMAVRAQLTAGTGQRCRRVLMGGQRQVLDLGAGVAAVLINQLWDC